MTKTIVIGNEAKEIVQPKPIVFEKRLSSLIEIVDDVLKPNRWEYIELIAKDYAKGYDLMFGYDEPDYRGNGTLYLGYWNDGIV